MRILFVHSGADMYGASRSLLRLSSRLARDGNLVTVIIPYDGPLREKLQNNKVKVLIHESLPVITRQRFSGLFSIIMLFIFVPVSIVKLLVLIRRITPDIIHTNTSLILSPGMAAKLAGIPHVWHVREFFPEFPVFWKWYQWFMCYFSNTIVCVSTPVARQFTEKIFKRKIVVINNGFPQDEFEPVEEERVQKFRKQFGLNGFLTVGVIGRIKFGRKGQDVFIEAAALLEHKYPNVKFVLIGSPFPGNEEHLDNLMKLVKEKKLDNRVIYTGDVKDIKAAFTALDISVLPSGFPEPFGGVVIESMAFGKPVVCTKLGGTMEQVEHGVSGLLVEPNDPGGLADALEVLLSDQELRQKMGTNGRKRFLRLFEFEAFYEKIISLYERLT